jgi:hypothetical protein
MDIAGELPDRQRLIRIWSEVGNTVAEAYDGTL